MYGDIIFNLPSKFKQYPSDRFRAKTTDQKTTVSITVYQKDAFSSDSDANKRFQFQLDLYEDFVKNGGYEPYDDIMLNNQFVSQSFKVDMMPDAPNQTQYYFTTLLNIKGKTFCVSIIIRERDVYLDETRNELLQIGQSLLCNMT